MMLVLVAATAVAPVKEASMMEKARAERVSKLKAEDGWLTLVGLSWLSQGEQTIGRAASNGIVVKSPNASEHLGTLKLEGKVVRFRASPGSGVTLDGKPVSEEVVMTSDAGGKPTVMQQASVSFYVIERAGRLGVRIKDAKSPVRTKFGGLEYFPNDPDWRVEATFEPYTSPKRIKVPTMVGVEEEHEVPGRFRFQHDGRDLALEAFDDGEMLMIVFADKTSGKESYGAGRFLYVDKPKANRATLDFNLAESPPCAFTAYATCPLPPAGNRLAVAVTAGEKTPPGPH